MTHTESESSRRSIAIYGAGAVGGYLGVKLAATSHEAPRITLIARRRVAEAVRARGLVLREFGNQSNAHATVVESAAGLPPQDLVLLTVRAYDVASSIDDLRGLIGEHGVVAAFQNGVGTEEELGASLGRDRVLACTLTVSVSMEEPGVITRYSRGGGVALATMDGAHVPAWIVDLFGATGLPTNTVDDYRSLRWSKLLLNMLAAATSAILDLDIDGLIGDPRVFRLEQLAFREAGKVMDAQGIRTVELPGYPVPMARLAMRLPQLLADKTLGRRIVSARAGRSPGMRGEMAWGRSEVAWYNGAVADAGRRIGVPTPVNSALAELTLELVAHPEMRERYRGSPEALAASMRERGVRQ